jgi:DNA mismatch endonuclease (patch repair protein)
MAAVRRSDTRPELDLRRALHAAGYRYRKDYAIRVDGRLIRPDIVFTRKRVAIFVDGCFWHGCPLHGETPASNVTFWNQKLSANVTRDRMQDRLLDAANWTVVRIWEHVPIETALVEVVSVVDRNAR